MFIMNAISFSLLTVFINICCCWCSAHWTFGWCAALWGFCTV